MRAAVYRSHGPATEVLAIEEIDTPVPGPGEVRVRVAVSGVNPTDWKSRSGAVPLPPTLPDGTPVGPGQAWFQVPNQDGSGVVEEVGPGVDPARIGERVWLYLAAWRSPWGTAAEYTVVPADQAIPLPDGVSYTLGASIGVPAVTAHRCLFSDGPVDGLTVLVAGGAGAVGHFAIELARASGATVVTTVSGPDKAKLAQAAGAHYVVNYRDADAVEQIRTAAPEGVDRFVEVSLGDNLEMDLALAAPNATIVTYAATAKEPTLPVRQFMTRNLGLRGVLLYTMPQAAFRHAALDITSALAAGVLTPLPTSTFPLDETASAHDAVEGGAVGKVLVEVDKGVA